MGKYKFSCTKQVINTKLSFLFFHFFKSVLKSVEISQFLNSVFRNCSFSIQNSLANCSDYQENVPNNKCFLVHVSMGVKREFENRSNYQMFRLSKFRLSRDYCIYIYISSISKPKLL